MGALFLCLVFMGYSNAAGVLPIVANARVVFYRERAANMYTVEAFALASVSGEGCGTQGKGRRGEGRGGLYDPPWHVCWQEGGAFV